MLITLEQFYWETLTVKVWLSNRTFTESIMISQKRQKSVGLSLKSKMRVRLSFYVGVATKFTILVIIVETTKKWSDWKALSRLRSMCGYRSHDGLHTNMAGTPVGPPRRCTSGVRLHRPAARRPDPRRRRRRFDNLPAEGPRPHLRLPVSVHPRPGPHHRLCR